MAKRLSLEQIIKVVDKAYNPEEQLVLRAFKGEQVGDGPAEFLARELKDTYSESVAQNPISEAVRVIYMARNQLTEVACALVNKLA
jgi:hypothetical protein